MSKILLIGGAGYLGCVITRRLLEGGFEVRIVDSLLYGDSGLEEIRDRIEILNLDMREVEPETLEGIDAVINIGGLSNDPTAEFAPRLNYEVNTLAAVKVAQLCRRVGVPRYIFASTCSIYDQTAHQGTSEEFDVVQDEKSLVRPLAAYSRSKWEAEAQLLKMVDDDFCPVILRKGTLFGFSPRMRYDLVVNTFVKDALSKGRITIFKGGEMWRPLLDVRDAARAYIYCLRAKEEEVRGEIFNLSYRNLRISELALRVREAFRGLGIDVKIEADYSDRKIRSYRVSAQKIEIALGFKCEIPVEVSVMDMVPRILRGGYNDFENPRYYNIRWLRLSGGTIGEGSKFRKGIEA